MIQFSLSILGAAALGTVLFETAAVAEPPRSPDQTLDCELLIVGGGLSGVAAAYEGLLAGRTVCQTEITDWLGGQISSQGTSALDERDTQRALELYPRGYLELRDRIREHYGRLNPGDCWVSAACFLPEDGHQFLLAMVQDAARQGDGTWHWFPNTVVKDLDIDSRHIQGAIAIQHQPATGAPPLNTEPLSQTLMDAYQYDNSDRFTKTIVQFRPSDRTSSVGAHSRAPLPSDADPSESLPSIPWYVIDATETGELVALADMPHRLGIDPRFFLEPSSSSETADPYCTQGFTYTFAMEATADPQPQVMPPFYPQYAPYYSYELDRLASFPLVFTYRRIWSTTPIPEERRSIRDYEIAPGDISMQNWTWGNDYRPGTRADNLIYTRRQLVESGQLQPGGWLGGLRVESLRRAEELAQGYYYWLVAGNTDSQLGDGVKQPHPNHRYLAGLDSPMGTAHGLSKYPYMRESRRIIGRPSPAHPQGFTIWEADISRQDFRTEETRNRLLPRAYERLRRSLSALDTPKALAGEIPLEDAQYRTRATLFPDSVGIGHYAIDFHPCLTLSPPEQVGNSEREGERWGAGAAYPFQIPLRAMIPQKLDNLLVTGKSIAVSHIAAAAYRVHAFEWSAGAAIALTADFALETGIPPHQLVDDLPLQESELERLQHRIRERDNPTAFPGMSIFNNDWRDWR